MANILCIDTSTNVGSVAFGLNGEVIIDRVSVEDRTHAVKTGVFMDEVLSQAEAMDLKPDAIAVCSGPGSYTGLRIGVSIAKGLCYGFNIPLIAVDALKVMAYGVLQKHQLPQNAVLCPMIDARRMEVYMAAFDTDLNRIEDTVAEVVDETSLATFGERPIYLFGSGSDKCKDLIFSNPVHFIDAITPLASNLLPLAHEAFKNSLFEDVAYFEPFYLKDFIATVSRKNVLGL